MILAIDPSILSLGYAIFEGEKLLKSGTVVEESSKESLEDRICRMIEHLQDVFKEGIPICKLETCVIEKPQLWGAYKSVASMHSGSLLGLHVLVGALYWWGSAKFQNCHLIPVSEWKGQLPKRVTKARVEKLYGIICTTDDESDAVGLGSYFIKRSKNEG